MLKSGRWSRARVYSVHMICQDDGGEGQNVGSRVLTEQLSEGICAQHRVELCGCGLGQEMILAIEKPLVLEEGIERVAR